MNIITAIQIDKSKSIGSNFTNKYYINDISEIKLSIDCLPNLKDITDPVPFYYHLIPMEGRKSLFKVFQTNMLHISKCTYFNDNNLYMISEPMKSWNIKCILDMKARHKSMNSKAIYINKKHNVWGLAIFFQVTADFKPINTSKDFFIKNFYYKSDRGNYNQSIYYQSKRDIMKQNKELQLSSLKSETYTKIAKRYNDYMKKMRSGEINIDMLKNIIHQHSISDSNYIELINLVKTIWKYKSQKINWSIIWNDTDEDINNQDKKKHKKLIDIQAIKICIWKYFAKDIEEIETPKIETLQKEIDEIKKAPKEIINKKRRTKVALDFLRFLDDNFISTLEDLYVTYSAEINDHYIKGKNPFYQSSASFHSIEEYGSLIIGINHGVKVTDNTKKQLKYLTCKSVNVILTKEMKKNISRYRKLMKKNNYKFYHPLNTINRI